MLLPLALRRSSAARPARSAAALALASLLSVAAPLGCSYQAYEAGSIPPDEVAVLRVKNYRTFGAAWNAVVEKVDGEPTPWAFRESSRARNFLFNAPAGGEKTIRLAPGRHTLELALFWDQFLAGDSEDAERPSYCTLTFVALPGVTYELESDYWSTSFAQWLDGERDWTAWVVRSGTGEVVSEEDCTPRSELAATDAGPEDGRGASAE